MLDWMVAKCLGYTHYEHDPIDGKVFRKTPEGFTADFRIEDNSFCYDWALAGPIIEREKISIRQWTNVPIVHAYMPVDDAEWASDGASPLIAAMRCFVISKLGNEVEVPDGLA